MLQSSSVQCSNRVQTVWFSVSVTLATTVLETEKIYMTMLYDEPPLCFLPFNACRRCTHTRYNTESVCLGAPTEHVSPLGVTRSGENHIEAGGSSDKHGGKRKTFINIDLSRMLQSRLISSFRKMFLHLSNITNKSIWLISKAGRAPADRIGRGWGESCKEAWPGLKT